MEALTPQQQAQVNEVVGKLLGGKAIDFMAQEFRNYTKQNHGRPPKDIDLGKALFDQYEMELTANQRFVYSGPAVSAASMGCLLAFKSARVHRSHHEGWYIEFDSPYITMG